MISRAVPKPVDFTTSLEGPQTLGLACCKTQVQIGNSPKDLGRSTRIGLGALQPTAKNEVDRLALAFPLRFPRGNGGGGSLLRADRALLGRRRDDCGEKSEQGLKPLIAAMIAGTTLSRALIRVRRNCGARLKPTGARSSLWGSAGRALALYGHGTVFPPPRLLPVRASNPPLRSAPGDGEAWSRRRWAR